MGKCYSYKIALSFATEDQDIVEKVYHYLKGEGFSVFYAPAPECQIILSGTNQHEVFYKIFGLESEYVALFVSKSYLKKRVPMEEASIAFAKHGRNGSVIPIYLEAEIALPSDLLDPNETNYLVENNPAKIAEHLASKMNLPIIELSKSHNKVNDDVIMVKNNIAQSQIFIHTMNGEINV